MEINITSELMKAGIIPKIRRDKIRQTVRDSAQLVLNSTQMGYVTRQAPDGTPWADNPQWWQDIKGQSSPLTGPLTTKIQGGEMEGAYKLKKVNAKRMKNSLIVTMNSDFEGIVEYEEQAKERADINQHGGEGKMEFISLSSSPLSKELVFDVKVTERPHLGVATYPRVGGKTDAEWIETYFGNAVQETLEGK